MDMAVGGGGDAIMNVFAGGDSGDPTFLVPVAADAEWAVGT